MTVITNSYNIEYLEQLCDKIGIRSVKLDRDMVNMQKKQIESSIASCNNRQGKALGKAMLTEINKIIKHMECTGKIEFCWQYKDETIRTYPAIFVDEPRFGVRLSDAIVLDGEIKVVDISIPDIQNLIAFEYGRKQIGYDNKAVEEAMNNIGIAGFHDVDEIRDCIKGFDYTYNQVKGLNIEDSEYYDDSGIMQGYFNKTVYNTYSKAKYASVVTITCRLISSIIATNATELLVKNDERAALVSVGANKITMVVSKDTVVQDYIDTNVIKIVGRQFRVNTIITETF